MIIIADGSSMEITTPWVIEGMAGLSFRRSIRQQRPRLIEVIVQIRSHGWRMKAHDIQAEMASRPNPVFATLLVPLQTKHGLASQVFLFRGRARLHKIEKRACRWLFNNKTTHDLVGSDVLLLTHEFLAVHAGRSTLHHHVSPRRKDKTHKPTSEKGYVRIIRGKIEIPASGLEDSPANFLSVPS